LGYTGGVGLRESKKLHTRQEIADRAMQLFAQRGFDHVTVAEVAKAANVSEKTVYNYFPTKESLLFDREDDTARQINEALVDRNDGRSVVESILDVLERDVTWLYDEWKSSGRSDEGLSLGEMRAALLSRDGIEVDGKRLADLVRWQMRRGRVRRAKLYYLRNLQGKAARIRERREELPAEQGA